MQRIAIENTKRAEGELDLRNRKPIVEVSPEATRSRKEGKSVGDIYLRPQTRRKRKGRQQKASSVGESTWASSAAVYPPETNYEYISACANLGLKKRKTKSPVKTLTTLPIRDNLNRLTAESRRSGREIEALKREVARLTVIVKEREFVYSEIRRNRKVIGNLQRDVASLSESVKKIVANIGGVN